MGLSGMHPVGIGTALPEARVLRAHQHPALLSDTSQRDGPHISTAYTKGLKRKLLSFPFSSISVSKEPIYFLSTLNAVLDD